MITSLCSVQTDLPIGMFQRPFGPAVSDRKTRRSRYFSTGRSRTTRRLRIFQRNHLLDFVKISKYFKVRSGKRRTHEGLSTGSREQLADCGSSSVITFWTLSKFQNISKSKVGRDRAHRRSSRLAGRERLADWDLPA